MRLTTLVSVWASSAVILMTFMIPLMCQNCGHHRLGWTLIGIWVAFTGYLLVLVIREKP